LLFGEGAVDTLFGGSGNDTLDYGSGDEVLSDGGSGDDSIVGGAGNDTLTVSAPPTGSDTLDGSEGYSNLANDDTTADGDIDVLDLSGLTPGTDYTIAYEPVGGATQEATVTAGVNPGQVSEDGTVTFSNGETLVFRNIETVICFVKGTLIDTPEGPKRVEELEVGDLVTTKDNGAKPLQWIGKRTMPADGKFAPILIRKGTIGNDTDLMVSPQHRILFEGWQAELMFGKWSVLAPAIALKNDKSIFSVESAEVEYIHIMFDQHELVMSNGCWTESFYPGDMGIGSMEEETRREFFEIFPELEHNLGSFGETVRPVLKSKEAQLFAANPDILWQSK